MIRKVTVIGLGTLGGFLCKHISELENMREIILVDHDIVERHNVTNSVYRYKDIGEFKTNALADLIGDNVSVTKINKKFIEGQTILPKSDLIIDCRDIVCERLGSIDFRMYLSQRILILDCRRVVRNICEYNGHYSMNLSKSEISKAAFFATQIINSDQLLSMKQNELIHKINLDILANIVDKEMQKTLDNKVDLIYDLTDSTNRLHSLAENIKPILALNKLRDIPVYIGQKNPAIERIFKTMPEESRTKYAVIPKNSLKGGCDVISSLANIIKKEGYKNFIVSVRSEKGNSFIELLEETGAA